MARYILKFSKEGYIRYTSHLDMLRLFKRSFKKAGISLEYSQGFNPHPKMGFIQPLSLGYSSIGELLEFTTKKFFNVETIINELQIVMPEGIRIIECEEVKGESKSFAARCDSAEYIIAIPLKDNMKISNEDIEKFLSQKEIIVFKKKKKSKDLKEVDIKNQIRNLTYTLVDDTLFMSTEIDTGSNSNLSPELLLQGFFKYMQWEINRETVEILRRKLKWK